MVICKKHGIEYGLVAATHMDIGDAVNEFSNEEGRAKVEEALRNKDKSSEELPFKSQGVTHSVQYSGRTYRLKTGLNKEEWEWAHGQNMNLKNPGDAHPVCWALKEDGSGEIEKLWLFSWSPISGYRTVEVGSGMATNLNTPILKECRHFYKDQGVDAFTHVSKKFQEDFFAGANDPGQLSESVSKCGGSALDSPMHPLGYSFDHLPDCFKPTGGALDADDDDLDGSASVATRTPKSKVTVSMRRSFTAQPNAQEGSPPAGSEAFHDRAMTNDSGADMTVDTVADSGDACLDEVPLGAEFQDVAAAPQHCIALPLVKTRTRPVDQDDEVSMVSTQCKPQASARNYIDSLDLVVGQRSAKLGNIFIGLKNMSQKPLQAATQTLMNLIRTTKRSQNAKR